MVQIQSAADVTRHDDGGHGDRAAVFVTAYSLWQDMFIPAAWRETVSGVLADRTSPEHQTPANPDIKRGVLSLLLKDLIKHMNTFGLTGRSVCT